MNQVYSNGVGYGKPKKQISKFSFKRRPQLSAVPKIGAGSNKEYVKASIVVKKLADHMRMEGYGTNVHPLRLHGAGIWTSINGFLKKYKVGSNLLKIAAGIAPVVGFPELTPVLTELSQIPEYFGYGK